ncbi:MAG: hypothetical protein M5R42_14475 [Rhodocyclaceae bacterium]|nr:hypothetical protein [Rhodocyclaceae bacterium]
MHARSLLQEDVHLGNFLIWEDKLYIIDGDAVRPAGAARECLDNLALLFAQLPPAACSAMQPSLLVAYRKGNPDFIVDATQLETSIVRARERRPADYLDKCLRDCSLFKVARRTDRFFPWYVPRPISLRPW